MAPNSYKLAPSVLSADFGDLRGAMEICHKGGAHWIHIDVWIINLCQTLP